MWILLIISFIDDSNEYKVTEFNRYETRLQCNINEAVLQARFEEKELTACVWEK